MSNRQPNHGCDTDVKLNRRNVLAGLGTAAAGTAAIFGTGAFEQEQVDRDFIISITDDDGDNVQLPISPNEDLGTNDRVRTVENGEVETLEVDATNLPQDATVTLGAFDESEDPDSLSLDGDADGNGAAFTVENQNVAGVAVDIDISLESYGGDSDVRLVVVEDGTNEIVENGGDAVSFTGLETGDELGIGIWIDTADSDSEGTEEIDITLDAAEASQ